MTETTENQPAPPSAPPIVQNGVPTTSDPRQAATEKWIAAQEAKRAAPVKEPKSEPEAKSEPAPAEPAVEKPKTSAKDLAAKLAGKPDAAPKKAGAWDETATKALSRIGLREQEAAELSELLAEKPWVSGWLDKLQKVQAKQDADYAALKSAKADTGTREPTPGTQRPLVQERGDQPGSGQVADLFETLTSKLGEELGDENAKLLRQAFGALQAQNHELREELHGHTRSVQVEREAAEIEVMVQKSRASLREEFPWIDDDTRFEAVAAELAGLRPDELSPDGIKSAMRKAARIVGYDEVRADAAALASKLDTRRKTRSAETAPGATHAGDDGEAVLDEFEISLRTMKMLEAQEPKERVQRWVQQQHERRRQATKR